MNRANEVRPMFRRLADVAERTGCAVILIGHLNKAAGGQSAYRGLGSIDFRAAAKERPAYRAREAGEPELRVIVHDKSSLAPEGKPLPCLGPETGLFVDERIRHHRRRLLSGAGGNRHQNRASGKADTDLRDGKNLPAGHCKSRSRSRRNIRKGTVQNAKRNMGGILGARRVGGQWYNFIRRSSHL